MGGRVSFAGWFIWVYGGIFFAVTVWAGWWLIDVVRRPLDAFPGTWPATKLRWGVVPAAWLGAIVLQTALFVIGLLSKQVKGMERAGSLATAVGLGTAGVLLLMVVVGVAYLLRVVFPSDRAEHDAAELDEPGDEGPFPDDV